MTKWLVRALGFVFGCLVGTMLTVSTAVILWVTRETWFEAPTGDDLQYFDLMVWLCLLTPLVLIPVNLVSGLIGTRMVWTTTAHDNSPQR